jgi:hypothetical protein
VERDALRWARGLGAGVWVCFGRGCVCLEGRSRLLAFCGRQEVCCVRGWGGVGEVEDSVVSCRQIPIPCQCIHDVASHHHHPLAHTHVVVTPSLLLLPPCRYGFQRIVPSVDLMAAKQYYTTTIVGMWYLWCSHESLCWYAKDCACGHEVVVMSLTTTTASPRTMHPTADNAYSNIITNGDLAPGFYDPATGTAARRSVAEAGIPEDLIPHSDTRAVLKYHNHTVSGCMFVWVCDEGPQFCR